MVWDEEEDLREDLRGFPFERRMGADAPLESGGGEAERDVDEAGDGGGLGEEVGKDMDWSEVERVCSSSSSSSSSWSSCRM